MVRVHVISGFLGSGKTTLIRSLIESVYPQKNVAVLENDFGETGIDSAFLRGSSIVVSELNAGCVCCSLTGRLQSALAEIVESFSPECIFLEPSGAAHLSDVLRTLELARPSLPIEPGSVLSLALPMKISPYRGRFFGVYKNQLQNAGLILPSHTERFSPARREAFYRSLAEQSGGVPVWKGRWQQADALRLLQLGALHTAFYAPSGRAALLKKAPCEGLSSVSLSLAGFSDTAQVQRFLGAVARDSQRFGLLVRAKGFFEQGPGPTLKIDYAGGEWTLEPVNLLAPQQLVLIGAQLKRSAILQWAEACAVR